MNQIENRLLINGVHQQQHQHYNSDSDRDEDEKNVQNEPTIGIEIEMQKQNGYNHPPLNNIGSGSNDTSQLSMPYEKYEMLNKRKQSNRNSNNRKSNRSKSNNRHSSNSSHRNNSNNNNHNNHNQSVPYMNGMNIDSNSYTVNVNDQRRKRTASSMNNNDSHHPSHSSINNPHGPNPHSLQYSNQSIPIHPHIVNGHKQKPKLYPIPSDTMTQTTTFTQYLDDKHFDKNNLKNIQNNNTYYMVNHHDDDDDNMGLIRQHTLETQTSDNITIITEQSEHPEFKNDPQYKLLCKIMLDQSSSIGNESDGIAPLNVPNDMIIKSKYQQIQQLQHGKRLSPIVTPLIESNVHGKKRKSQSEMSESRKSGKSFVTYVEEKKQIEISANEDEDEDDLDDLDDDHSDSQQQQQHHRLNGRRNSVELDLDATTNNTNGNTRTNTVDHDRQSHRNMGDDFDSGQGDTSTEDREEKSPLLRADEDEDEEDTLDHGVQTSETTGSSMRDDDTGNSGYIQGHHQVSAHDMDDEPQSFEDEESYDDFEFDASNNGYEKYMKGKLAKNGHYGLQKVASESSITNYNNKTHSNMDHAFSSLNSSLKQIHDYKGKSYGSTSGSQQVSQRNEDESLDFNETQSHTQYTDLINDDNFISISEDIEHDLLNNNNNHNPAIKGYNE